MKWLTREKVKVDRVACPWLIKKFLDPAVGLCFGSADKVMSDAARLGPHPSTCYELNLPIRQGLFFEAILRKYKLDLDSVLDILGKIVNEAATNNSLWQQPPARDLRQGGAVDSVHPIHEDTDRAVPAMPVDLAASAARRKVWSS